MGARILWVARLLTVLVCLAVAPASAALFNFTYDDVNQSTGVGFDDPTLGATRRGTLASAGSYLGSVIDAPGTVDVRLNASQTDGSGFLASAGTFYYLDSSVFQNGLAFEHATSGTDPWAGNPDATATFDFGYTWNSDQGAPAAGEIDLYSVALHEFMHTLGFASLLDSDGTSGVVDPGNPGVDTKVFSVYDSLLETGVGTQLFSGPGNFVGTAADLISGDVFLDGANIRAANGNNPLEVYAPNPWSGGSSISHVDPGGLPGAVMTPSIGGGQSKRELLAPERGVLSDLGWTLQPQAVPEPPPLVLLAGGTLSLWIGLRRRKGTSR